MTTTNIVVAIITGSFGLITATAVAFLAATLKFRKDLEAEYDKDLRSRRIEVYKGLWHLLQFLARYDLPESLSPRTLRRLSVAMREWYFEMGGGLYLTEKTRTSYFALKEAIKNVVEKHDNVDSKDILDPRDSAEIAEILEMGHELRRLMTQDVGTRQSSPILARGKAERRRDNPPNTS